MTDQETLAKFTSILRDLLLDDSIELTMETRREDVPNWDSFNYINFIVAVEIEFGVKFKVADIESFPDVGAIVKETMNLNDSGQETSYSYTAANGRAVTCTFSPHGAGPDFPVTIGMSWTLEYTFACAADSPVTYRQMGSVADIEAVTVPAGAFSALKLQSTLSWTDLDGTTITRTVTNWRDVRTMFSVKEIVAIAYSGTIPANGRAVNTETVLESGPE